MERSILLYVITASPYEIRASRELIFPGMHHTDRPAPQAALARSLSSLLLALPTQLFLSYLAAFWTTMISYYGDIPSLRLDKYLYLIRLYVASSFLYLSRHEWNTDLVDGWKHLMEGTGDEWTGKGASVLNVRDEKVPDGLRYHVLDVWVDALLECDDSGKAGLLEPVQRVATEGKTKVLRNHANSVLEDERLLHSPASVENEAVDEGTEDFEGFAE